MDLISFETPLEFKMFEEVMQQGESARAHVSAQIAVSPFVASVVYREGRGKSSVRLRELAFTTRRNLTQPSCRSFSS